MYAVILAGGKGKRFWPYSTSGRPKQFLDITGDGSMLLVTYRRLSAMTDPGRIIVLTLKDQVDLVRRELPGLSPYNIFAEPSGRNTAPSLAAAAAMIRSRGSDEPVLCCPSDHLITDTGGFHEAVSLASEISERSDVLVTFGIEPGHPATGYGYIEAGDPYRIPLPAEKGSLPGNRMEVFSVKKFYEKPSREKASDYIAKGGFFWNSGIFMWRPSVFLDAWNRFLPDGRDPLERMERAFREAGSEETIAVEYARMPEISVDYGILEKAGNVVVIPVCLGWNDVGSWDALYDILPLDDSRNAGAGEIKTLNSSGNIFFNPGGLTAAIGVNDIIVVVNRGTVMVCKRGESQKVRDILEELENGDNGEFKQ